MHLRAHTIATILTALSAASAGCHRSQSPAEVQQPQPPEGEVWLTPQQMIDAKIEVQPIEPRDKWLSDPWTLTERDGRLYGRGSADDKGAIPAQLYAVAAFLKTRGSLPVNVKVLCEGEEEVGSRNLDAFFKQHKDKLHSDVIVVCDTENAEIGLPALTYSLRGIVEVKVEVRSSTTRVHSGMAGGMMADAALAFGVIASSLRGWRPR